jgi:hypothetical protein
LSRLESSREPGDAKHENGIRLGDPAKEQSMKITVMSAAALVIGSVALAVPAGAASTGGHCPPPNSGYIVWDVNAEPYQADNRADTFGGGNGNGIVCAKPMKVVIDENGNPFQIYNFIDDKGALPQG